MKIGMTAATALLTLLLGSGVATAADVVVKDNGTALRSGPAGDAGAAWKVNSGFPLTVVEGQGDWLKVQSSQLPEEDQDLWVRADQVAAVDPGADAAAPVADSEVVGEEVLGYRIDLTGTPGLKVRLECRVEDDGHVLVDHRFNRLPRTYEYPGDAVSCVLFKKQHHGEMRIDLVALYPTKERLIGSASSQDYPTSIFARSRGPWGVAAVVPAQDNDLVLSPAQMIENIANP